MTTRRNVVLPMSRRRLLATTTAAVATGLPLRPLHAQTSVGGGQNVIEARKAMTFDMAGTVVDFYTPILKQGEQINRQKNISINWAKVLEEWRGLYRVSLDAVVAGKRPFIKVDAIFREALDTLAEKEGLPFTAAEKDEINGVWHRQVPWQDVIPGLTRLRERYILSTLSNQNMSALVDIVKLSRLPFDCILSAELAKSYKPAREVYQLALDHLGVSPSAVTMVACHKYDLKAAKFFGFRTAFVPRALEFGPSTRVDASPETYIDIYAKDFEDLADKLGA
jgi:2-haloacid dehalogenase